MRPLPFLIALLCAAPALAAEGRDSEGDGWQDPASARAIGDGTYRGSGEFAGGGPACKGMLYRLDVSDREVRAVLTPPPGSSASGGIVAGTLRADGTVVMGYGAPGNSGWVDISLTLSGDRFTGYSRSQTCRYSITAVRE